MSGNNFFFQKMVPFGAYSLNDCHFIASGARMVQFVVLVF